ncbi:MAG: TetR family transcriptional regulator [Hyphomicrobiales bacterium]
MSAAEADFSNVLAARADEASLRKSDRTRLRLLSAIARELQRGVARGELKVAAVADAAGVAHGTLYRYFPDLAGAVEALVEAFAGFVMARLRAARDGEPASRARVAGVMLAYARLYRGNAGLMRCLVGLGEEESAFAASYARLNREWYLRMAAAIARRRGIAGGGPGGDEQAGVEAMLPVAYALGGMVDEFLAQVYLRREPALAALGEDEAAVAALLTELWCLGADGAGNAGGAGGVGAGKA